VIYLDYNATTPVDPQVLEVMTMVMTDNFANASSSHAAGLAVRSLIRKARGQVADLAGTAAHNIVFTSGATESAAIAWNQVGTHPGRNRVLVAASEHQAVLDAAKASPATVEFIRVRTDGLIDHDHLESLLDVDVAMVAVMAANNETGVVNDITRIAGQAHRVGALMFCDVTQMLGKLPVRLDEWGVDLAIGSAHKIYGPAGVGMLVVAPAAREHITALYAGGGQERGLRGGTHNAPGIVGFGLAAEIAATRMEADAVHQRRVRSALFWALYSRTNVVWYARRAPLVPNTLFVRFPGASADAILSCLPDVAASAGAACSSGTDKPSHVLTAMGVEPGPAAEAIRFSVGRQTTLNDVRQAAELISAAIERVHTLTAVGRRAS
jgi:cysteine desulfurase